MSSETLEVITRIYTENGQKFARDGYSMKVLVLGATGFLGNIVQECLRTKFEVIGTTTAVVPQLPGQVNFNYAGKESIEELIRSIRPNCIVNCIALADVDRAELDPSLAEFLNFELPRDLSVACQQKGIRLIHISTDHFESSINGLQEDQLPNPINVYGHTKLAGDLAVLENAPSASVVRTNFFARSQLGDRGLIDFLINAYKTSNVVSGYVDVYFNPVGARFLAACLEKLVTVNHHGILNISSSRLISKYEFLYLVAERMHFDMGRIEPIDSSEISGAVRRPRCMSLNPTKLQAFLGFELPSIESQLDEELSGIIPLPIDKESK
jgi:dTDP-4-dehydrorhamnose reductase